MSSEAQILPLPPHLRNRLIVGLGVWIVLQGIRKRPCKYLPTQACNIVVYTGCGGGVKLTNNSYYLGATACIRRHFPFLIACSRDDNGSQNVFIRCVAEAARGHSELMVPAVDGDSGWLRKGPHIHRRAQSAGGSIPAGIRASSGVQQAG